MPGLGRLDDEQDKVGAYEYELQCVSVQRKGFGRSGHRGAKHPVMLSATAPSTSGASLKKHCQISLTEMSFWEVTAGKWYNHI